MKSKCYSLLLVGLALLLLSFTIGCGQSQSEAYQEGYKAGFTDGYEAGLAQSGVETVPTPTPTPDEEDKESKELPPGAIWWYEAKDHIGDRTTVCLHWFHLLFPLRIDHSLLECQQSPCITLSGFLFSHNHKSCSTCLVQRAANLTFKMRCII